MLGVRCATYLSAALLLSACAADLQDARQGSDDLYETGAKSADGVYTFEETIDVLSSDLLPELNRGDGTVQDLGGVLPRCVKEELDLDVAAAAYASRRAIPIAYRNVLAACRALDDHRCEIKKPCHLSAKGPRKADLRISFETGSGLSGDTTLQNGDTGAASVWGRIVVKGSIFNNREDREERNTCGLVKNDPAYDVTVKSLTDALVARALEVAKRSRSIEPCDSSIVSGRR